VARERSFNVPRDASLRCPGGAGQRQLHLAEKAAPTWRAGTIGRGNTFTRSEAGRTMGAAILKDQPVSVGTMASSVANQVRPFSSTMTLRVGPSARARRCRNWTTLGARQASG
jgi:hypothetical protein